MFKPFLKFLGFLFYDLLLLLKTPVRRGGALDIFLQSFALSLFFLLITAVPILTVGNPLEGYVRATVYFIKSAVSTYPEMYGAPTFPQKDILLLEESSRILAETAKNLKMFAKEHQAPSSRRLHVYTESVDTVFGESYPLDKVVHLSKDLQRFGDRYKQQTSNLR